MFESCYKGERKRMLDFEILEEAQLFNLVDTLSSEFFGKPYLDRVVFNYRLRTTGGRYIPKYRLIELNPKYYREASYEEFVGIIKHELCHYHLHIEGKGYQHRDPEFKQLLKETNSPRFCKPLPSHNKHLYEYVCVSCNHVYKRKIRMNEKRYRCGICNGKLKRNF